MINLFGLGTSNYTELFTSTYGQVPICPNYGSYNDSSALPYESGVSLKSSAIIAAVTKFLADMQNIPVQKQLMELQDQSTIGSNNWAVDGNKSSTGKPILCNDMHLQWMMPGIWYEAHMVVRNLNLNIYGFTMAGIPLIIAGHNDHLAWGFTNTGYDVMDWYYYIGNSTHYNYNGSMIEYGTRTYNMNVKDAGIHTFTVKETVHGPVLSDFLGSSIPSSLTSYVLAPRWTANNISRIVKALVGMNMATNWVEFNESVVNWDTPAQNIIYADVKGNIAIRPTGIVPIRDDTGIPSWHFGNGTMPYNGSNGEGEWIGYVPFQEIPYSMNPQQGYLVSANQIAVGPEYTKYHLQTNWATGYRARRINELLNNSADGTIGIEKMKEIQLDIKSTAARAFVPYFINATENFFGAATPTLIRNMVTQLKNWDYDMDKDLAAPTIYRKWRDYYYDYTFNDEFNFYTTTRKPAVNILEQLTRNNASSLWFNDINTATTEDRDTIIIKALNATSEDLVDFYGTSDVSTWRWGDVHKLSFEHLIPQLESLNIGPFEGDGSGYTVTPSGVNIRNGVGEAHGGASERLIVDLSDMKNSISVIPSGQRGISSSEHYSDQLEELFLQGKYHRQYFYNESSDFPTSHIESQILFRNVPNPARFTQLINILVFSSIIGVICVVGAWGIKKVKKRGGER
jgi:penicillin amidase